MQTRDFPPSTRSPYTVSGRIPAGFVTLSPTDLKTGELFFQTTRDTCGRRSSLEVARRGQRSQLQSTAKARAMNEHQQFHEELLSGYLDGELSADELSQTERMLAANVELRSLLHDLRSLDECVTQLSTYTLDTQASDRILAQVTRVASGRIGSRAVKCQVYSRLLPCA